MPTTVSTPLASTEVAKCARLQRTQMSAVQPPACRAPATRQVCLAAHREHTARAMLVLPAASMGLVGSVLYVTPASSRGQVRQSVVSVSRVQLRYLAAYSQQIAFAMRASTVSFRFLIPPTRHATAEGSYVTLALTRPRAPRDRRIKQTVPASQATTTRVREAWRTLRRATVRNAVNAFRGTHE